MKRLIVVLVLFVFVGSMIIPAIASDNASTKNLIEKVKDDGKTKKKDKKKNKECKGK